MTTVNERRSSSDEQTDTKPISDGNVHVMPAWEPWHIESAECPCHPNLEQAPRIYEGQRLVYVHRATSEEGQ